MKFRSLLGKKYHPLNTIEISQNALKSNYSFLSRQIANVKIAPVLKSNAYGHGITQIAKILDKLNPPFFCVDSLYEAYELLKNKIKTPILITGYIDPENLKVKKLPFSYAVYDKNVVEVISKYQPHAGIHVFVDTGMYREGISVDELPDFLDYLKSFNNLKIEGIMSHLAESENINNPLTKIQLTNFTFAKNLFKEAGILPKWIHIANSGAILNHKGYSGKIGNLARCGIAVYGVDPTNKNKNLVPVLEFKSKLNQVKSLSKGDKVGYNFTYRATKNMKVGILPVGYFDGVDRRLSNKGYIMVNNQQCRIIGRISMNITAVELSNLDNPKIGDSVVIYSNDASALNSISNAANVCETIPYDLLVHLTSTTKRKVVT